MTFSQFVRFFYLPFGASPSEIHCGGQPDTFCFVPCSSWMMARLEWGCQHTCSQFVRFFVLTFGASPFGGRAVAFFFFLAPYCVCVCLSCFISFRKEFEVVYLPRYHPRRRPWLVTNSRDSFSSRLVPVLAEGSQGRFCPSHEGVNIGWPRHWAPVCDWS